MQASRFYECSGQVGFRWKPIEEKPYRIWQEQFISVRFCAGAVYRGVQSSQQVVMATKPQAHTGSCRNTQTQSQTQAHTRTHIHTHTYIYIIYDGCCGWIALSFAGCFRENWGGANWKLLVGIKLGRFLSVWLVNVDVTKEPSQHGQSLSHETRPVVWTFILDQHWDFSLTECCVNLQAQYHSKISCAQSRACSSVGARRVTRQTARSLSVRIKTCQSLVQPPFNQFGDF